jgi:hypothetical protein
MEEKRRTSESVHDPLEGFDLIVADDPIEVEDLGSEILSPAVSGAGRGGDEVREEEGTEMYCTWSGK